MGVIRAEPARVTDWAAKSVGLAWRAFDWQLLVFFAGLFVLVPPPPPSVVLEPPLEGAVFPEQALAASPAPPSTPCSGPSRSGWPPSSSRVCSRPSATIITSGRSRRS